ncbi:MAG: polar amino acid ABC transporter permease [Mameliella sp.]|nr:polar amino acid ABC transporter permease [Mameliella sp.]
MFSLDAISQAMPYLKYGLITTLWLGAIILPLAFLAGLLVGIVAAKGARPVRLLTFVYIDFFRSFPPLVLIIFVFYALPFLGLRLPEVPAFALAMTLNGSSYFAEIIRAGILSIPKGQTEAARSTGLSATSTMIYVVLPQALRNVLPPLLSNSIELFKATSLASVVAIAELLRSARIAQGVTFDSTPLVLAALIYLVILWPCVRILSRLERNDLKAIR